MTDAYVYYFKRYNSGDDPPSSQRATREAIAAIGKPVAKSQIVVDDSELDADGFYVASVRNQVRVDDLSKGLLLGHVDFALRL